MPRMGSTNCNKERTTGDRRGRESKREKGKEEINESGRGAQ